MNTQMPKQVVLIQSLCTSRVACAPYVETLCRTVSIGGNVHVICTLGKNIQYTCDYKMGMPGTSDMRGLAEGVCISRSGKLHLLKGFNPSHPLPFSQLSRTLWQVIFVWSSPRRITNLFSLYWLSMGHCSCFNFVYSGWLTQTTGIWPRLACCTGAWITSKQWHRIDGELSSSANRDSMPLTDGKRFDSALRLAC